MSIPKSIRFEIFKRDKFTCQYCGRQTPLVVLEIDHIIPKSKGGTDNPNNLITCCSDCNRGKAAVPLSIQKIRDTRREEIIQYREKKEQIEAYEEFLLVQRDEEEQTVLSVYLWWSNLSDGKYVLNDHGISTVKKFLKKLTPLELTEAMEIAAERVSVDNIEGRFKYFCGVCHNKIAEKSGDTSRRVFKEVQRHFLNQRRGSGYHREYQLRQFCRFYPKETLIRAIDIAFSERRSNYWKAVCDALAELTATKPDIHR